MTAPRFKVLPVRDEGYRKAARLMPCEVCGRQYQDDVVLCHIRPGMGGGVSLKPSDDEALFLCANCHAESEDQWLAVLKAIARRKYQEWRGR